MAISGYVKAWLVVGLFMLFMQIIIGGITRLTGSGLSITKWEIVLGTIPPIGEEAWTETFDLYKETPQYQKINKGMTLSNFKFIYFWEYLHRLWARLMGFVFLFPFLFFVFKRMVPRWLMKDLGIVVLLAGVAASFGWIMVASGLQDRPWVNAYKLSIHLIIGFSVFCYLLWTFFKVLDLPRFESVRQLRTLSISLIILIVIQILFGGWMSGMKAGLFYPSWPDMNGEVFPQLLFNTSNWRVENLINYDHNSFAPALIQFLHRTTAYVIMLVSAVFLYKLHVYYKDNKFLRVSVLLFSILLITQVFLGIFTLIHCVGSIPVALGVIHQAFGLLVLSSILLIKFQLIKTSL